MNPEKTYAYLGILFTLLVLWLLIVNLIQHNNSALFILVAPCLWWPAYFISFKYYKKSTFVHAATIGLLSIPLVIEVVKGFSKFIKDGELDLGNPYSLYLYGISGILAIIAGLINKTKLRLILIFISMCSYWFFLQKYVAWSYSHPFNPSDGAAMVFASVFGWLIGLLFYIIPIWGITNLTNQAFRCIRARSSD
jgi:hypothetical protein